MLDDPLDSCPTNTEERKTLFTNSYPNLICKTCALKNGGHMRENHVCSMYKSRCEWCERITVVTEARDWGYPTYPGKKYNKGGSSPYSGG